MMVTTGDLDLDRLQGEYGHAWHIWRTPRFWMATALTPGVEPTLIEDTPEDLETRMCNPGHRIGGPPIPGPR